MQDPLTFEDVDHLVVDVAVIGRPTWGDDAVELRHVAATDLVRDEVAELPISARREHRLVEKPDRPQTGSRGCSVCLRRDRGDGHQLLRAWVFDLVRLAGRKVDARARLELVFLAVDDHHPAAGRGIDDFLEAFEPTRERTAQFVPSQVQLEEPGTRRRVDRGRPRGGVTVETAALQLVFVHDIAGHAAIVTRIRFEFDEYALPVEYRRLGGTGLELSRVGLGCGNFGGIGSAPELFGGGEDETQAFAIMDRAEAAGINFFDTAASYGGGRSESWIGYWKRERESPVLLSTKVYWSVTGDPEDRGLARERVLRELAGSLSRLQADRVDMYLTHEPDPETPIEETISALDELVGAGKVGAIGVSNVNGQQLKGALAASDSHGLARVGWIQNEYSLLRREAEQEVLPLCAGEGLGFTPFSPLCGGWLTGKYRRSEAFPADSRMALRGEPYSDLVNERTFRGLERFQAAAAARGVEPAELAIAWVSSHPQVTSIIVGPRRPEQLDAALKAVEIKLSEQERDELAELFA
jgi:1-deoxyxylulose-5-phosphate synthase